MNQTVQTIIISALTSLVVLGGGYVVLKHTDVAELPEIQHLVQTTDNAPQTASVPDVVASSTPAVVSITITADVPVIERYYDNFWSPFGGGFGLIPRQRQVGTQRQEVGGGTGFFVSPDGYLITNRHVVDQDDLDYAVVTNDGETYDVEVIAKDPSLDVAVLKVDADQSFPHLTFADTDALRLGETVIAIGNALAEFPNSVSVGVVSGLSRDIIARDGFSGREALEGVIQTDAAINQGNSGGPLLNLNGEVVGMNVAIAGSGENIGFALPATVVGQVYESVAEHGEIVRPFLGVRTITITEEMARRNSLPVDYGALVVRGADPSALAVIPSSPADKAGLVENDIILSVEGEQLDGSRSLAAIIRSFEVGERITLTVLKDGEEVAVTVTLERRPEL